MEQISIKAFIPTPKNVLMILLKPIGKFLLLFISIPCFAQWNLNSPYHKLIDSLGWFFLQSSLV